jgi:hypothetical protein
MPRKKTQTSWTAEILPLLGTVSDAKLGKRVGRSAQTVGALRRRLGIKTFSEGRHPWGETELGLLRSYTDKEIAAMTSRKIEEIAAKRREIS